MSAIRFQDPGAPEPAYLLTALLAAADKATYGGAFFAFASRDGTRALLDDPGFKTFLDRADFNLIIGVDAITNEAALDALAAAAAANPRLSVRAFLHSQHTLFHPKMCWFATEDGAYAFVGSGNLTTGGLLGNWEAYAELVLDTEGASALEHAWKDWLGRHSHQLLALTDSSVRTRASQNVVRRRATRAPTPPSVALSAQPILLAEIPRAENRWKQANFDLATFTGFFGADPKHQRQLILSRLRSDGSLDGIELRPTVSVRSHNYRIELDAATGLTYPAGPDVPIGAFLRVAFNRFRYRLLMPTDPSYRHAAGLLDSVRRRTSNRMRRIVFDQAVVASAWPDCPLLVASDEDAD